MREFHAELLEEELKSGVCFFVGEELWREHEREIKVMRKGLKEPEILARIF